MDADWDGKTKRRVLLHKVTEETKGESPGSEKGKGIFNRGWEGMARMGPDFNSKRWGQKNVRKWERYDGAQPTLFRFGSGMGGDGGVSIRIIPNSASKYSTASGIMMGQANRPWMKVESETFSFFCGSLSRT